MTRTLKTFYLWCWRCVEPFVNRGAEAVVGELQSVSELSSCRYKTSSADDHEYTLMIKPMIRLATAVKTPISTARRRWTGVSLPYSQAQSVVAAKPKREELSTEKIRKSMFMSEQSGVEDLDSDVLQMLTTRLVVRGERRTQHPVHDVTLRVHLDLGANEDRFVPSLG